MSKPIPMLLWCPLCHVRHIDQGEFATRIHHTHSCQHCGLTWRPAVIPTVGVRFLPGFKDDGAQSEPEPVAATTEDETYIREVFERTQQRRREMGLDPNTGRHIEATAAADLSTIVDAAARGLARLNPGEES